MMQILKKVWDVIIHMFNMVKIKQVMEYKYAYVYIIILWIVLIINGYVTETRLIWFSIILIIISIYKILHKQVKKLNVKESDITILLKIYKYKNPIILLIIELELKMSNFIYNLTKKNINTNYINIIYNVLYNFTGFNGIKIVLVKFYEILTKWTIYSIYEIMFKRIYGMILSVLIFTNIIEIFINFLNQLNINKILLVYICLILISYVSKYIRTLYKDIVNLEIVRMRSNLIGTILQEKQIDILIINNDVKNYLWYSSILEYLNYTNFLKYKNIMLAGSLIFNKWLEYACRPSFFYFKQFVYSSYCYKVYWEDCILIKQEKLERSSTLLSSDQYTLISKFCDYNILLWKLKVFYIWDVEKTLNITNSYYEIGKIENDTYFYEEYAVTIMFEYNYNLGDLEKFFYSKIKDIELNKFWDLTEHYSFYEKMHNIFYDVDFLKSKEYKKSLDMFNDFVTDAYAEYGEHLRPEQQIEYLKKELKNVRKEWEKAQTKSIIDKYENIFNEILILKNKYNT